MLKIYKTNSNTEYLKKINEITSDSWIDLIEPTENEIDKVVEKLED